MTKKVRVEGEQCYSWCAGANDIMEYLECIRKCDEGGMEVILPNNDDLGM